MTEATPDPLVASAAGKAGLVWVTAPDGRPQALWHVWHFGLIAVVVGGEEQKDPFGSADRVRVSVPSKDNRARLVSFDAAVEQVQPGDERWDQVTFAVKAGRLNAVDADTLVDRWAAGSRVLLLHPADELVEKPGSYDDSSGAAPPPPTPATTVTWRPFHAGGRKRRRRPLR
jgi:hypothetical protein